MNHGHKGEFEVEIRLINFSGPLNDRQYEQIIQTFQELAESGVKRLVVNLKDVPFIDSRGLAALVTGFKLFGCRPDNFRLAELQCQPKLVFELTGFDYIFEIFDSVAEVAEIEPNIRLEFDSGLPVTGILFNAAAINI